MAKYLLLKHYRGAPAPVNDIAMDRWTPQEISDHVKFMQDFAARLEETGEFVDAQGLAPEGTWVRYDGSTTTRRRSGARPGTRRRSLPNEVPRSPPTCTPWRAPWRC